MKNKKYLIACMSLGTLMIPTAIFGKTIGTVNASALIVRKGPSTNAAVVTKVYSGDKLEVLEPVNSNGIWYKILTASNQTAYVKQDYLELTKVDGTSTVNNLNIRSYPDVNNSTVLFKVNKGDAVEILYKVGKFYKVNYKGKIGFVFAEYIDSALAEYAMVQPLANCRDIITGQKPGSTISGSTNNSSNNAQNTANLGEEIVAYAKQFLGNPYVYGGNSLTNGVDCSGFTQQVMKKFGINIPRTSSDQSRYGKSVSTSELKKGDLLFFGPSTTNITHVGLFIGDGQMIHSSTPATGIIISNAYSSNNYRIQVARRVI